jgi:hypothetical protein
MVLCYEQTQMFYILYYLWKNPSFKSTYQRPSVWEVIVFIQHYNLRDGIFSITSHFFNQGTNVGFLTAVISNGADASPWPFQNSRISFKEKKEFIDNGESIIYEATFQYNGVLVALRYW